MSQLYQNTKNQPALTVPVRGKPDLVEASSDTPAEVQRSAGQEPLWVAVSFPFLPLEALGETAQQLGVPAEADSSVSFGRAFVAAVLDKDAEEATDRKGTNTKRHNIHAFYLGGENCSQSD